MPASLCHQVLHAAFFIIQFQKCNAISNTFQKIFAFRSFIPNSLPIWFFIRHQNFFSGYLPFPFSMLWRIYLVSRMAVCVYTRGLLSRVACWRFRYTYVHIHQFFSCIFHFVFSRGNGFFRLNYDNNKKANGMKVANQQQRSAKNLTEMGV